MSKNLRFIYVSDMKKLNSSSSLNLINKKIQREIYIKFNKNQIFKIKLLIN